MILGPSVVDGFNIGEINFIFPWVTPGFYLWMMLVLPTRPSEVRIMTNLPPQAGLELTPWSLPTAG